MSLLGQVGGGGIAAVAATKNRDVHGISLEAFIRLVNLVYASAYVTVNGNYTHHYQQAEKAESSVASLLVASLQSI
jgi:hypothetical protein